MFEALFVCQLQRDPPADSGALHKRKSRWREQWREMDDSSIHVL